MKRLVFCIFIAAAAVSCMAQKPGKVSVIPHVGANFTKISNERIVIDDQTSLKSKSRKGWLAGVEVQYDFEKPIGIYAGAYYSQQGCDFNDMQLYDSKGGKGDAFTDTYLHTDYLNFVVGPRLYIEKGVALETGLQFGTLLRAEHSFTCVSPDNKEHRSKSTSKELYSPTALSIPIGISYEYENVILGVRYHLPLTDTYKGRISAKQKNRQLAVSIGYRLPF